MKLPQLRKKLIMKGLITIDASEEQGLVVGLEGKTTGIALQIRIARHALLRGLFLTQKFARISLSGILLIFW